GIGAGGAGPRDGEKKRPPESGLKAEGRMPEKGSAHPAGRAGRMVTGKHHRTINTRCGQTIPGRSSRKKILASQRAAPDIWRRGWGAAVRRGLPRRPAAEIRPTEPGRACPAKGVRDNRPHLRSIPPEDRD